MLMTWSAHKLGKNKCQNIIKLLTSWPSEQQRYTDQLTRLSSRQKQNGLFFTRFYVIIRSEELEFISRGHSVMKAE